MNERTAILELYKQYLSDLIKINEGKRASQENDAFFKATGRTIDEEITRVRNHIKTLEQAT